MEPKFIDFSSYKSVITEKLKVVGTENKDAFTKEYLNNPEVRNQFKLVGTHMGKFHCDEVMATSLLLRTKEFKDSIIVRTREQDIIDQLDVVVDVGGTFDVEKKRFDHHQKSFTETWWTQKHAQEVDEMAKSVVAGEKTEEEQKQMEEKHKKERVTLLSSAGLVYKFYGKEVINQICSAEYGRDLDEKMIDKLHE